MRAEPGGAGGLGPVPPVPTPRLATAVGAVAWIGFLALARPAPFATAWIHALLLFAVLLLLPAVLGLLAAARTARDSWDGSVPGRRALDWARAGQLPAGLLLAGAFVLEPGAAAALLALPWLAVTGLAALAGLARLFRRGLRPLAELALDAGTLYLPIGGAWTFADRAGFQPLEFSIAIVALTAVHFHYAGFLLPLVTGLAARRLGGLAARLAAAGVVAAVPLVAVGITATQLRLDPWVETVAALSMAAAGALAAGLHLRLAAGAGAPRGARVAWGIAGVSLLAGMAFAALYGSRFHLPVGWLDIGWMQILHGGVNAFGFGAAAVWGWWKAGG